MKYLVLVLCLLFTGCSTISNWRNETALKDAYLKKNQLEADLAKTKKEYEDKLTAQSKQITAAQEAVGSALRAQIQGAGDGLYGADMTYRTIPKPNRTDLIINNFVIESWAALGNPMPTYAKMKEVNERLKRELDESLTTLADLQKSHAAALEENKKLDDAEKKLETDLALEKKHLEDLNAEKNKVINEKQDAISQNKDLLIARERERSDDAKAIQASKEKLSWGAGILAALCVAGTIFSPIMKDKLATGAAVFGVAAVGIWYLTPIVVFTIVGIGLAGVAAWVIYNHHKDNKAAIATYSALEEIKTKSKDLWDKDIAPTLTSWQSKYVKTPTGIVTTPDPSISSHIDQKLMEVNQK